MSAKNTTLGADGQRHGATQSEGKFRKRVTQHKDLLELNETKPNHQKPIFEPMLPIFHQRRGWLNKGNHDNNLIKAGSVQGRGGEGVKPRRHPPCCKCLRCHIDKRKCLCTQGTHWRE